MYIYEIGNYYDNNLDIANSVDSRIQIGLLVGTVFEYQITKEVKAFKEIRYLYSLTCLSKTSSQINIIYG